MPRALLLIVTSAFVSSAMGQIWMGQLTFYAAAGQINYSYYDPGIKPWPVGDPSSMPGYTGKINIALYSARPGTQVALEPWSRMPNLSGWKMMTSPVISHIGPVPGMVHATICQLDPTTYLANGDVQCIVVAWTGNAPSFEDAKYSSESWLAWTGDCASGGSLGWTQKTGNNLLPVILDREAFKGLILGPLEWHGSYPGPVTAQAGDGVVYLSWQGFRDSWSYDVQRATGGGPYVLLAATTATNYVDTTVENDVTYRYNVSFCSYSPYQDVVTVTPHGPPMLQASFNRAAQTFRISWPDWATRFHLYNTTNLAPGFIWTLVTNAVYSSNALFNVLLEPSAADAQFYKLAVH